MRLPSGLPALHVLLLGAEVLRALSAPGFQTSVFCSVKDSCNHGEYSLTAWTSSAFAFYVPVKHKGRYRVRNESDDWGKPRGSVFCKENLGAAPTVELRAPRSLYLQQIDTLLLIQASPPPCSVRETGVYSAGSPEDQAKVVHLGELWSGPGLSSASIAHDKLMLSHDSSLAL